MSGQIHDLGYKRYVGTRMSTATRWRVIMREQISHGWKKWWRYKLALGGAVLTAFIAGGLLYFSTSKVIRGFGAAGKLALTFADGIVPLSFSHFCRMAFVLSLTLGATIIANDTKSGAFTFYYVRSVRPRDYAIGKLAGYGFLVATLVLFWPLLLAAFRLGLSDDTDQLIANLPILGKVLALGALATLAYTAIPLALSALVPNPRYALALWVAYYLVIGSIAAGLGAVSGSALSGLDIQTALQAITLDLFEITFMGGGNIAAKDGLDGTSALVMLLAQSVIAIGIIWYQVSRDQRSGVGGSS